MTKDELLKFQMANGEFNSEFSIRNSYLIMKHYDFKKRTKQFALRIIKLVNALPKTTAGRNIGNQLFRSGTSTAANYRAACRARSKAEFISKLGIVEEEADESCFWLELIIENNLMKKGLVEDLLKEANEIVAIVVSSKKSAKKNKLMKG